MNKRLNDIVLSIEAMKMKELEEEIKKKKAEIEMVENEISSLSKNDQSK
jgi:hypothetical protein